jgi:hypothetical protein
MNLDLDENVQKYTEEMKLREKNFGRNKTKDVQGSFHGIPRIPIWLYGSETLTL